MVSKEDVVYVVDEKKRKVVAYVEGTKYELVNFISENKGILPDWFEMPKLHNKLLMPDKFVGIATCSPDDEWNPEIGKLIAYHRMKTNMSKSFFKHAETYYKLMLKKVDETIDLINAYGNKLTANYNRRIETINQTVGNAED